MELYGIKQSPWSEKAKWALDHHGIEYRYREHLILFGEPWLSFRMGKLFRGGSTVPALIDGDTRLGDSFAIALHADSIGKGAKLFPNGSLDRFRELNALGERALDAGRALVMDRVRRDPEARRVSLEGVVPKPLAGVCGPLVDVGLAYLTREFQVSRMRLEEHEGELREVACALDRLLEGRREGYLHGGAFSYADVILAVALQPISPPEPQFFRLPEVIRRTWVHPRLEKEFAHLLEWRDWLYKKHRSS